MPMVAQEEHAKAIDGVSGGVRNAWQGGRDRLVKKTVMKRDRGRTAKVHLSK